MFQFLKKYIPADFFLRLWYHKTMTFFAALYYGFPARNMMVIGVTGTDGKTTTSTLIHTILSTAGYTVGLTSTTHFAISGEKWTNTTHKTTLGRFYLQKMLKKMKIAGCTHLVLEVSSHALEQGRIIGIPIDIAVMTNMSNEHLDFHKTFSRYKKAKLKLFHKLMYSRKSNIPKTAIYNLNDNTAHDILNIPVEHYIGYGIDGEKVDIDALDMKEIGNLMIAEGVLCNHNGTSFSLRYRDSIEQFSLQLIGKYNISNALAAISVASVLNIEASYVKEALATMKVIPGRFEIVVDAGPLVAIDYAVTENAFRQLFTTARSFVKGKLIIVFGSCGDRDTSKRFGLGEVASHFCDVCIITDEEPYTEDPAIIRGMILEGVDKEKTECHEIPDRKDAIKKALEIADDQDMILVTGMGDQTSMIVGTKKIPWSDREVICEEWNRKSKVKSQRSEVKGEKV